MSNGTAVLDPRTQTEVDPSVVADYSDPTSARTAFWTHQTGAPGGQSGGQGPPGPAGPTGPVGMNWRGAWAVGTAYAINDGVSQEGSSYIAIAANTGSQPPSANWNLLAQQGAAGTAGAQGPPGPQAVSTDANNIATLGSDSKIFVPKAAAAYIADLGTITTDQNIPAAGASSVILKVNSAVTQTRTITLTQLPQGAAVQIWVTVLSSVTLTLKLAGTDAGGHIYQITGLNSVNGTPYDLVGVGYGCAGSYSTTYIFAGWAGFNGNNTVPFLMMSLA